MFRKPTPNIVIFSDLVLCFAWNLKFDSSISAVLPGSACNAGYQCKASFCCGNPNGFCSSCCQDTDCPLADICIVQVTILFSLWDDLKVQSVKFTFFNWHLRKLKSLFITLRIQKLSFIIVAVEKFWNFNL